MFICLCFHKLFLIKIFPVYSFTTSNGYTLSFGRKIPISSQIMHPSIDNAILRTLPNGQTVTIKCPKGSYLDSYSSTCEFLEKSPSILPDEQFNIKFRANKPYKSILPNKEDCKSFILSGPSGFHVMQCSGNLLFNADISSCDYPYSAHCCEYWEKGNTFF